MKPVHFRRHHQTGPDAQGTARTTGPLPTGAVGSGWVPDLTASSFTEALGCPRGTCWPASEGMARKGEPSLVLTCTAVSSWTINLPLLIYNMERLVPVFCGSERSGCADPRLLRGGAGRLPPRKLA